MTEAPQSLNLLIVEDDQSLAASLKMLAQDNFKVFIARKPSLVPDHVFFHAALVDLHLEVVPPETADGLTVIEKLSKRNNQTEIVAMSGNINRVLMEKSIQAGAQRFLAKPLSADELNSVLSKIEAYWNLRNSLTQFNKSKVRLLGNSAAIEKLRKQISLLRNEKTSVLIEGETGVGKDVVAQILNLQEQNRPYVAVNCSAISENLFESEFFGHIKGSFTGADTNKVGYIEAAHGGDLFLDEIETLSAAHQAKLLRFLESGEIRKVGAKETQKVDVRIIAASNIPLKEMILDKKFREDLYYRLNSHHIVIPPLRERIEDIEPIAQHFIDIEKHRRNKTLEDSALKELKKYNWPGNVRELKRVCEQLLLTSPLPIIRDADVNRIIRNDLPNLNTFQSDSRLSLDEFIKKQEKQFIKQALDECESIDIACDKLKISKSNLYKKIKDLGINNE